MGGISQNIPGETQQQKQARLAQIQVPPEIQSIPGGVGQYRRLINQGSDPAAAANIVLKGGHEGGRQLTNQNVNEARNWEQFRDPACPPNAPYRPDPNHWKNAGMPWMDGAPPQDACLEKPQDWDKDTAAKGYMTPQGWNQGTGMPQQPQGAQGQQPQQQPQQPASGLYDPNNPLQNQLVAQFQRQGGMFGATDMTRGNALSGGGIWSWGNPVAGGGGAQPSANPLAPRQERGPVGIGGQQQLNPFQQTATNLQGAFDSVQNNIQQPQASPLNAAMYNQFRPGMTSGSRRFLR